MAHSYTNILIHYIFSTKNRCKIIKPELEERLLAYMCGIAKQNNIKVLGIGGVEDHLHLLLSIPKTISVSKAIQLVKGGSSKWVHDTFSNLTHFGWQEGYAAFSIGVSQVKATVKYIQNQKEHHRKKSFQEEYLAILKKNEIDYDERYIWD